MIIHLIPLVYRKRIFFHGHKMKYFIVFSDQSVSVPGFMSCYEESKKSVGVLKTITACHSLCADMNI